MGHSSSNTPSTVFTFGNRHLIINRRRLAVERPRNAVVLEDVTSATLDRIVRFELRFRDHAVILRVDRRKRCLPYDGRFGLRIVSPVRIAFEMLAIDHSLESVLAPFVDDVPILAAFALAQKGRNPVVDLPRDRPLNGIGCA